MYQAPTSLTEINYNLGAKVIFFYKNTKSFYFFLEVFFQKLSFN